MKYTTIVECRKCGRKGHRSAMVPYFQAKLVKPEHQRHYCTARDLSANQTRRIETHFLSKSHCHKAKGHGMAKRFKLGSVILDKPEEPQASTSNAKPVVLSAQVEVTQLSTSKMETAAALSWVAKDQVEKSQSSSSKVKLVAESVVTDKAGKS